MRRFFLTFVLVICATDVSFAWGVKGHKVVASIALIHLSDNARTQVENLLGADLQQFIEVATWADEVRFQRPQTAPWHFVDIPFDGGRYDIARDCNNNDCVVAKINEFVAIVGDKQVAKPVRAEALKWVIHFVGDVHQPLHAANDNDRGGNEVFVRITGRTDKLHAWWDAGLVDELGSTVADVANTLAGDISDENVQQWSQGTPEDWANESFKIAHDFIYARSRGKNTKQTPIILPDSYVEDATPLIAERLQMAGVRLASVLNQALK
jgi:nuclease S1